MSHTAEHTDEKAAARRDVKRFFYVVISVAGAVVAYFLPLTLSPVGHRALAVTVFILLMWVTEAVPLAVTGLLGCWLYWVFGGLSPAKAFAGFHNDSPWFVLGGILLGLMADTTGLAKRIAYNIVLRAGTNYGWILGGMMLVNFLLTFMIPASVPKTVLMCAISIGLIESYGMGKGSNIGKGLLCIMTFQAGLFDKVIMAGAAAILSRGLIESVANIHVSYALWFVAFLPVTVFTMVGSWFLVMWLFPPEKKRLEGGDEFCRSQLAKMGPMSSAEIKATVIFGLTTLLWATDFIHHVSPSKVGLIAGLFACLPVVGVIRKEDFAKANFPIVIFIGSAMCLGQVVTSTEILKGLTEPLFRWMTPVLQSSSVAASMLLYWYSNLFHLFLPDLSLISAVLPPLLQFAMKMHFNPLPLGMLWAFADGGKVFIYQQSALAVGYAFGYFTARDLFKLGLGLFFVESFLLLVVIPWFWPLLGLSFHY